MARAGDTNLFTWYKLQPIIKEGIVEKKIAKNEWTNKHLEKKFCFKVGMVKYGYCR